MIEIDKFAKICSADVSASNNKKDATVQICKFCVENSTSIEGVAQELICHEQIFAGNEKPFVDDISFDERSGTDDAKLSLLLLQYFKLLESNDGRADPPDLHDGAVWAAAVEGHATTQTKKEFVIENGYVWTQWNGYCMTDEHGHLAENGYALWLEYIRWSRDKDYVPQYRPGYVLECAPPMEDRLDFVVGCTDSQKGVDCKAYDTINTLDGVISGQNVVDLNTIAEFGDSQKRSSRICDELLTKREKLLEKGLFDLSADKVLHVKPLGKKTPARFFGQTRHPQLMSRDSGRNPRRPPAGAADSDSDEDVGDIVSDGMNLQNPRVRTSAARSTFMPAVYRDCPSLPMELNITNYSFLIDQNIPFTAVLQELTKCLAKIPDYKFVYTPSEKSWLGKMEIPGVVISHVKLNIYCSHEPIARSAPIRYTIEAIRILGDIAAFYSFVRELHVKLNNKPADNDFQVGETEDLNEELIAQCAIGDASVVRRMLSLPQVDPTRYNKNGTTALHMICHHGHQHLFALLLEVKDDKMDLYLRACNTGRTPMETALDNKQMDFIEFVNETHNVPLPEGFYASRPAVTEMETVPTYETAAFRALSASGLANPNLAPIPTFTPARTMAEKHARFRLLSGKEPPTAALDRRNFTFNDPSDQARREKLGMWPYPSGLPTGSESNTTTEPMLPATSDSPLHNSDTVEAAHSAAPYNNNVGGDKRHDDGKYSPAALEQKAFICDETSDLVKSDIQVLAPPCLSPTVSAGDSPVQHALTEVQVDGDEAEFLQMIAARGPPPPRRFASDSSTTASIKTVPAENYATIIDYNPVGDNAKLQPGPVQAAIFDKRPVVRESDETCVGCFSPTQHPVQATDDLEPPSPDSVIAAQDLSHKFDLSCDLHTCSELLKIPPDISSKHTAVNIACHPQSSAKGAHNRALLRTITDSEAATCAFVPGKVLQPWQDQPNAKLSSSNNSAAEISLTAHHNDNSSDIVTKALQVVSLNMQSIHIKQSNKVFDVQHKNSLHDLLYRGNLQMFYDILSRSIDVNIINNEGDTPLIVAVKVGEYKTEYNNRNTHKAALQKQHDYLQVIRALLDNQADVGIFNRENKTALHYISIEYIKRLIAQPLLPLLCTAIMENNIELIRRIMAMGVSVLWTVNNSGDSMLHLACRNSTEGTVMLLLDSGASINALNTTDQSPIMLAAMRGHIEMLLILFQVPGLNLSISDTTGNTAMHYALGHSNQTFLLFWEEKRHEFSEDLLQDLHWLAVLRNVFPVADVVALPMQQPPPVPQQIPLLLQILQPVPQLTQQILLQLPPPHQLLQQPHAHFIPVEHIPLAEIVQLLNTVTEALELHYNQHQQQQEQLLLHFDPLNQAQQQPLVILPLSPEYILPHMEDQVQPHIPPALVQPIIPVIHIAPLPPPLIEPAVQIPVLPLQPQQQNPQHRVVTATTTHRIQNSGIKMNVMAVDLSLYEENEDENDEYMEL